MQRLSWRWAGTARPIARALHWHEQVLATLAPRRRPRALQVALVHKVAAGQLTGQVGTKVDALEVVMGGHGAGTSSCWPPRARRRRPQALQVARIHQVDTEQLAGQAGTRADELELVMRGTGPAYRARVWCRHEQLLATARRRRRPRVLQVARIHQVDIE